MLTSAILLLIVAVALCVLAGSIFIIFLYTRVPFVRTPWPVIELVIKEAGIQQTDTMYDLGCGNARVLLEIEKRIGAKTVGYELSPWAYMLARLNIMLHRAKTEIRYKNFYHEDLSDANVVFCFLLSTVMPKIAAQLEQQLKPGSRVISFAFPIHSWKPAKVLNPFPEKEKASKIYIYQR
ncbi:MAG: N-6 DNA methylase [Patescibacteria group bacterium]|nr:N-6 DNA methylase [Patescibacteria group bacterium]MDD5715911.1 N-6 DNA methylase [Patescibacteria group bacterium]